MKHIFKMIFAGLAVTLASQTMAQEAQKPIAPEDLAAVIAQCPTSKAPANWDIITVVLERQPKLTMYNMAHVKGEAKAVDLDVSGCDIRRQAGAMAVFASNIPANQAAWKQLIFQTQANKQYAVFTDIAYADALKKK